MTDRRFDNRTKSQFKKDIKNGTRVESFLFQKWLDVCKVQDIPIKSWDHNGVNNDGEYIETGKSTAGADYRVSMEHWCGWKFQDEPVEVKFVPTAGKFTLKVGDMKSYIKERANILFIYNTNRNNRGLRMPRGGKSIDSHLSNIESSMEQGDISWGLMIFANVKRLYNDHKDQIFSIPYMGNKPGFVLTEDKYDLYFKESKFYIP